MLDAGSAHDEAFLAHIDLQKSPWHPRLLRRNLRAKAQKWDKLKLVRVIEDILAGKKIRGWPPGLAFEHAILRAFELEGAEVTWPFRVELDGLTVEQIDGAVHTEHLSCLIESKSWLVPANIAPVNRLRAQLTRRPPGTFGVVFAANGFTESAKTLIRHLAPTQVLTWEGAELKAAIAAGAMIKGLIKKHRHAVEHGLPDFSLL